MTKIKLLVMISVVVIRITSTMNKEFGGVASICPSWCEILAGQSRQITPIAPHHSLLYPIYYTSTHTYYLLLYSLYPCMLYYNL